MLVLSDKENPKVYHWRKRKSQQIFTFEEKFLLKEWHKLLTDFLNCCWLILCQSTSKLFDLLFQLYKNKYDIIINCRIRPKTWHALKAPKKASKWTISHTLHTVPRVKNELPCLRKIVFARITFTYYLCFQFYERLE